MRVIKNKILPLGKKFFAINLFGFIFAKGDCNEFILNHEKIHSRQMWELLILPFYLIYILEWLIKLIIYRNNYLAYKNISFEREAYQHQYDLKYLKARRSYSSFNYLINSKSSASLQEGNLSR